MQYLQCGRSTATAVLHKVVNMIFLHRNYWWMTHRIHDKNFNNGDRRPKTFWRTGSSLENWCKQCRFLYWYKSWIQIIRLKPKFGIFIAGIREVDYIHIKSNYLYCLRYSNRIYFESTYQNLYILWPFPVDDIQLYCCSAKCCIHVRINTLTLVRSGCNFNNLILNLVLLIGIFRPSYNALRWMWWNLTGDKPIIGSAR